jgi:hypothetical protein
MDGIEMAYDRLNWEAFLKFMVTLRGSEVQNLQD